MFSNILFVITLIFFGCLAKLLQKPMPGGDYGVGYAYGFLIFGAGFIISTGLLAWNMNVNHCFDWVSRYRNWLVFVGWAAFTATTFWSLEYHTKWNDSAFPQFMRWFAFSKLYIWLPFLVFGSCLYLINAQRVAGFPPSWVKIITQLGFSVSLLIGLCILGVFSKLWVMKSIDKFQLRSTWQSNKQAEYKATLDQIINYNDTTINWLLKFVEQGMDKNLRDNAIAKIKTYANWEDEMIAILTQKDLATTWAYDDYSHYVYAFLDGNKVEHPEKFIQPIKYSLKVFAIRAENDLDDPYKRELWSLNLESFCRTLESQFKDYAKEFKPGMLKLQQVLAIEYPERKSKDHIKWYDKIVKAYRHAVKNWLNSN